MIRSLCLVLTRLQQASCQVFIREVKGSESQPATGLSADWQGKTKGYDPRIRAFDRL
jgi:hypothetical protein